ncbi:hypothetical protein OH491_17485 [Termitidicoccus mucosus]|uniref:Uncharacterized protein n=1 Tax=Termitidicoccus mucosus TaxID=1184151 RepID=A0A178IIZ8_9BACT|nr:hypothetical protein AW736_11115 [Opitutaceae bacterium TSB47]
MLESQLDSIGRRFDPAKFLQKFDALGRWVNARAGRRKQNAGGSPFPAKEIAPMETPTMPETPAPDSGAEKTPPPAPPPTDDPPPPSFDDINAAANTAPPPEPEGVEPEEDEEGGTVETILGLIQIALMLIGQDEGVLSEPEKKMLRRPLERVLKKYNVGLDAMPCELELAAAVATIIIARLRKPKTRGTFSRFFGWIGSKWGAWRGRRAAAAATGKGKEDVVDV